MNTLSDNPLVVRDVADGDMQVIQEIYADQVLQGVSSWEEQPPTLNEMIGRRDAIVAAGNPYYVAKNTRGHGIGRCLMEALAERCEALGYRQMIAVIGDSENQLSIGFHRQMGFTQVGHIKSIGFKFGRWMDSIVMQRSLGRGDSNLP